MKKNNKIKLSVKSGQTIAVKTRITLSCLNCGRYIGQCDNCGNIFEYNNIVYCSNNSKHFCCLRCLENFLKTE